MPGSGQSHTGTPLRSPNLLPSPFSRGKTVSGHTHTHTPPPQRHLLPSAKPALLPGRRGEGGAGAGPAPPCVSPRPSLSPPPHPGLGVEPIWGLLSPPRQPRGPARSLPAMSSARRRAGAGGPGHAEPGREEEEEEVAVPVAEQGPA